MAQGFSKETVGVLDGTVIPPSKFDGRLEGARVRSHRAVLDLSLATVAKNIADTNVLVRIPRGQRVIKGMITSSVSLGTATVAIGPAATPGKYRAAAVFTATDTPTAFGVATVLAADPLTAFEDVIMTIGTAALPGAGIVVIEFLTSGR